MAVPDAWSHRGSARALAATALVSAAITLAACSSPAPSSPSSAPASSAGTAAVFQTPSPGAQTLSETGSSLMYPLFNQWLASATVARDIQAFLYWTITAGAAQLSHVNFEPLPTSVVTLSEAQITEIKADDMTASASGFGRLVIARSRRYAE
jgi:ABC-type phosphate transport system substrate-binding protein